MRRFRFVIYLLLFLSSITGNLYGRYCSDISFLTDVSQTQENKSKLQELNSNLYSALSDNEDPQLKNNIVIQIDQILSLNDITDTILLSDAYFLTGSFFLVINKYQKALDRLVIAARYRESVGLFDVRYAFCLSNLASTFIKIGDYSRALEYERKSINATRQIVGQDTSALVSDYVILSTIYLQMNAIEKSIVMAETGIEISRLFPGKVNLAHTASLYHDLGICLARKSEYSKSLAYFKEALKLYEQGISLTDESKQMVMIEIAETYRKLKEPEKAEEFYRKALSDINEDFLSDNFSIFVDYADFLSETGRMEEGLRLFERGLMLVKTYFGTESREYCLMLAADAYFIYKATGDGTKALNIYNKCLPFIEAHPDDLTLKNSVLIDYIRTMVSEAQYAEALKTIDMLLGERKDSINYLVDELDLGSAGPLSPRSLKSVLSLRYDALNSLAQSDNNAENKKLALETGMALISLYDRLRVEMSEESRIFLSEDARQYYLGVIENFADLYDSISDPLMLEGVFEYFEKSKVAAFLASMRELNASRFSLPEELSAFDKDLQKSIGYYRELITNETEKDKPDSMKVANWEKETFILLRTRDSLLAVFEKDYPDYYSLKYRTDVIPLKKVKRVIGSNTNLLSYVLADDKMFVFLVNNRNKKIFTCDIDTSFYKKLDRFRSILSELPDKNSARSNFNEYMELAYDLYNILLAPAVPYLVGDNIVISPENVISYLPFEALITKKFISEGLLYRDAPFALKEYHFSYIYSVTLSSETERRSRNVVNRLVAFAPSYDGMEIPDSLVLQYANIRGRITELPYAGDEARDAVKQCGGKAFTGKSVTESLYKEVASEFSIIHMAMHTLLDDKHPAYSKMIFAQSENDKDDGLLNTYEVYGIPLNATMVVLSSCNTGSGIMVTGEGILSLARGFLFAGSQSVVMSMWEVEDYSGAAIVKSFYSYLKKGRSKSSAMRSARLKFLEDADQVRSHPYYWATLVIYGDNSPLYFSGKMIMAGVLLLLVAVIALGFLVYPKPRS